MNTKDILRKPEISPALSVPISAHNEEAVLGRCLDSLLADAEPGKLEIVVANRCRDRTVEIGRSYGPQVPVIELEEASKQAALDACDVAATAFPRAYVDADIALSTAILRTYMSSLQQRADLLSLLPLCRAAENGRGAGRCSYAQAEWSARARRSIRDARRRVAQALHWRTASLAPGLIVDLPVFVAVTASASASRAANRKASAGDTGWERGDNARTPHELHSRPAGGLTMRSKLAKVSNGVVSVFDMKNWLHSLRTLHGNGYSRVRQKRKTTIGADSSSSPNVWITNCERIAIGDRVHVGVPAKPIKPRPKSAVR